MSLPPDSATPASADNAQESLLSPTSAASLPPNPLLSNPTIKIELESTSAETPADLPVKPPQPRTLGGFEVDDDEDENENEQDDGDDDGDVYDPEGLDLDASTPALQAPLDRQSQSPSQTNGNTPVPAQPTGSPGVSSSALPPGSGATPVTAETPAPALTDIQAPVSDTRPNVNGPFPSAVPRTRLAHDTIGILEDRIKEDPRGDPNAYLDLISEYKSRNKQDEVRQTYERYLAVFPTDVSSALSIFLWPN
jgi:cleavage stimulation factor subunit 3